jgi:hypothetical protein
MSKFTFICEDEPMPFADAIVTKKTFEFNADHLNSVVGEFETFLRGCGFHFEGNLEFVNPPKIFLPETEDDLDMYTESIFDKK